MPSDLTLRALAELFRIAEERQATYGTWLVASALESPGDATKRNLFTLICPRRSSDQNQPAEGRSYGTMQLSKRDLSWDEARTFLTTLVKEERFHLPGLPEIRMAIDMHPATSPLRCNSARSWLPSRSPYLQFNLNISPDSKMSPLSHGPVYSADFPIYATTAEAIYDFAGLRSPRHADLGGDFWVLLPDFRAQIRKLRLSSTRIGLDYDFDNRFAGQLIGKLCVTASGKSVHSDFALCPEGTEREVTGFPERLVAAIMSKSGEVVDDRDYFSGSSWVEGVEFELAPTDLEHVVLAGESSTLEFKRGIPKRKQDIAISVTAMANCGGGRILIGVDEVTSTIVGYEADKPEETLRNILSETCDPPVVPQIDVIQHGDNKVVSITVREGSDKPYGVKNKGVYVRNGSTNRIATRYELDLMYQAGKSSPLSARSAREAKLR